ncbi:MAG TPA: hypothetical protein VF721_21775 [Pyrinomonadaceae bacterium]|jgi:hypothetical protein
MKRFGTLIILFLLCAAMSSVINAQKSEKKETIKATVIARYTLSRCIYHPCVAYLLVRVDDKKQTKYLRVNVEYFPVQTLPGEGFPLELVENSKTWKFKAVRDKIRDKPLEKYLSVLDENEKDISEQVAAPAWKLLPGAENEKLPFGEVLQTYFVKTRKFKLIK